MKFVATVGDRGSLVEITGTGGRYRVRVDDEVHDVDARLTGRGIASLLIAGASHVVAVAERAGARVVEVGGETYVVEVEEQTRHVIRTKGGGAGARGHQTLLAPLPGKVTHVSVAPGDAVRAGDTLLVIEAMKMENELRASGAGIVAEVCVRTGQAVNAGDVLVVIDRP